MKMPNKLYDVLKWVCLIALPALSSFYGLLANIWNLPYAEQIPATISGVALLIGSLIGISHIAIKKEESANEND